MIGKTIDRYTGNWIQIGLDEFVQEREDTNYESCTHVGLLEPSGYWTEWPTLRLEERPLLKGPPDEQTKFFKKEK
jgi:hypothetical protein